MRLQFHAWASSRSAASRADGKPFPTKNSVVVFRSSSVVQVRVVMASLRREARALVIGGEGLDHVTQIAVQNRAQVVHREPDAMVGEARLREIVGPYLVAALGAADLRAALLGALRVSFGLLSLEQARAQDLERPILVLELRALVLAAHFDPGRQVNDSHGGVGCVHVLSTGPAGAAGLD